MFNQIFNQILNLILKPNIEPNIEPIFGPNIFWTTTTTTTTIEMGFDIIEINLVGVFYDFLLGFCHLSKMPYVWRMLVIYFKNVQSRKRDFTFSLPLPCIYNHVLLTVVYEQVCLILDSSRDKHPYSAMSLKPELMSYSCCEHPYCLTGQGRKNVWIFLTSDCELSTSYKVFRKNLLKMTIQSL